MDSARELHQRATAGATLRGQIYSRDTAETSKLLSASLVLNDLSVIHYLGHGKINVTIPWPERYPTMFGVDQVRFRVSLETLDEQNIDRSNPNLSPCFMYSEGPELTEFMANLSTLIESGKVLFQPSRAIMGRQKSDGSNGDKWAIIGVDDLLPLDAWEPVLRGDSSAPTPLVLNHGGTEGHTLFEIVLPYVSGIALPDLCRLLEDEADLVASFRASLKDAIRQAKSKELHTFEFVKDVVEPKVGQIGRKFKILERIHGTKIGAATVGTIALAYTAASAGGVGAGLLAVASASGFGVLTNQYTDYLAKREELKNDPFYLLWKCKEIASKT